MFLGFRRVVGGFVWGRVVGIRFFLRGIGCFLYGDVILCRVKVVMFGVGKIRV